MEIKEAVQAIIVLSIALAFIYLSFKDKEIRIVFAEVAKLVITFYLGYIAK